MRVIIYDLLQLYVLLIFVRVILSYFPTHYGSGLHRVTAALDRVVEPVVGRVRKILPRTSFGGMGLDFSPMIVLLVIELILLPLVRTLP
ncbi:MAG: YggT family protein [Actinomycetota bacterium]|jgi:YggT family protein|nr:YggT family protein [Actinomycetota bacterium]